MKKSMQDIRKMFGEAEAAEVFVPPGRDLQAILPQLDLEHGEQPVEAEVEGHGCGTEEYGRATAAAAEQVEAEEHGHAAAAGQDGGVPGVLVEESVEAEVEGHGRGTEDHGRATAAGGVLHTAAGEDAEAVYEDFVVLETGAVPKKQGIRFAESALLEDKETDKDRIANLTKQLAAMHAKLASERSKVAVTAQELADNEARFARERTRLEVLERERANNDGDVHEKLHKSEETNAKLVASILKKKEKIVEQSIIIKRLQAALTAYDDDDDAPRGGPFDP